MVWLLIFLVGHSCPVLGPIPITVTRIVIFDHLDGEQPMYRELVCFDDDDYVIGGVVVRPDASPDKEYTFTQRFTRKRWQIRFQNQSYAASTMSSRQVFPKQAEIRFLLKESY